MIDVNEARAIVERDASEEIDWVKKRDKYLSEYYIERPYCWIFFADESIPPAPPSRLGFFTAYAINHLGNVRLVYDFRDDPQKMSDFADTMSKYFETHDE